MEFARKNLKISPGSAQQSAYLIHTRRYRASSLYLSSSCNSRAHRSNTGINSLSRPFPVAYVCSVHLINAHHAPSLSSASPRVASSSNLAFSTSLPDVVAVAVPTVARSPSAVFNRRTSLPPRAGCTFSLACSHAKATSPSATTMRFVSLDASGLFVGVVMPSDVAREPRRERDVLPVARSSSRAVRGRGARAVRGDELSGERTFPCRSPVVGGMWVYRLN